MFLYKGGKEAVDPAVDEEAEALAIIAAAVEIVLSSRPQSKPQLEQDLPRWRFSGRWWNEPIAVKRSHFTEF